MQLFFDGYIDLSSDNPDIRDNEPCAGSLVPYSMWYTHIGLSVTPYRSRLVAKGYQEVVALENWDGIKQVCRQVVNEGRRYLILRLEGHCFKGFDSINIHITLSVLVMQALALVQAKLG